MFELLGLGPEKFEQVLSSPRLSLQCKLISDNFMNEFGVTLLGLLPVLSRSDPQTCRQFVEGLPAQRCWANQSCNARTCGRSKKFDSCFRLRRQRCRVAWCLTMQFMIFEELDRCSFSSSLQNKMRFTLHKAQDSWFKLKVQTWQDEKDVKKFQI